MLEPLTLLQCHFDKYLFICSNINSPFAWLSRVKRVSWLSLTLAWLPPCQFCLCAVIPTVLGVTRHLITVRKEVLSLLCHLYSDWDWKSSTQVHDNMITHLSDFTFAILIIFAAKTSASLNNNEIGNYNREPFLPPRRETTLLKKPLPPSVVFKQEFYC